MSSRILGKDSDHSAVPIVWRQMGGQPVAGVNARPEGPATPPPPDVVALEARLKSLQAEMQARIARATDEGCALGASDARKKLEAPLRDALAVLAREIKTLSTLADRIRRDAEEDLVRLAIGIARRILRREIHTDPAAVLGLVKAALERVAAREVLQVRVPPQDVAVLKSHLEEQGMPERIEVVADSNLERGAAIVETTRGDLDASVETQLQEIERGFTDLIRRSR